MIPGVLYKKENTFFDEATFPFLKNGITQVCWVVEDLDKTVENFYKMTNISPWEIYYYGPENLTTMRRYGKDTEFENLTAVSNAGPLRLEIVQPISGDTVYQDFVNKYGYGGVQHFGIAVENMEESLEIARKAGIDIVMEGAGYGLDGDGYYAYLDTEHIFGIMLELMCRPKRRKEPLKRYPNN